MTATSLPASVIAEFAASAIGLELTAANVRWVEGETAVHEFLEDTIAAQQRQHTVLNADSIRQIERYSFLQDGAWVAKGGTIASPLNAPYAKPLKPRLDYKKTRQNLESHLGREILPSEFRGLSAQHPDCCRWVKYETPPKMPSTPLGPVLDPMAEFICVQWNIEVDPGETLWQAILRQPRCPVVVTEGYKKALALIQQGIPAIALRGVTQWHPQGVKDLWSDLWALCQGGRKIYIAFDQDTKVSTAAQVHRQATYLSNAIERAGGRPFHLSWHHTDGKGIDDALVAVEESGRSRWLDHRLSSALTPQQQRRHANLAAAKDILKLPSPQAHRSTHGSNYLPKLPPIERGMVNWLRANMGSGKTVRMGKDWVREWIKAGGIVVVFQPLNSLGQQAAKEWGIPHIHDYDSTDSASRQALEMDVSANGGIVACVNSAHRVISLLPKSRPLLVVIDEAAQTLTDAAEGGTLAQNWAARWEDLIALLQRAIGDNGAIALAEDGLDQATIDLVKTLSGATGERGISHHREQEPWETTLYMGTALNGFRRELVKSLDAGKRCFFVSTSQVETRRVDWLMRQKEGKFIRVDSQTNEGGRYREFFEEPGKFLAEHQPQGVGLTTSGKTGLSIEGDVDKADAFFDEVWGYFPTLDTDTHKQLLGRYRPGVPRFVWVPQYIAPEPWETPKAWLAVNDLNQVEWRWAQATGFEAPPKDEHDQALRQYLGGRWCRRWAQKIAAAESLATALEEAGHNVNRVTSDSNCEVTGELWATIKEALAWEDAHLYADLELDHRHTPEWAKKTLSGGDAKHEERCKATKVLEAQRFPGLDWNDPELWYAAEFCPKRNPKADGEPSQEPVARGAALWAEADYVSQLWAIDAKDAIAVLEQRLKAAHLLPKTALKAQIASLFKAQAAQLLQRGIASPDDPVVAQLAAIARQYAAEVRRYWRIQCTDEQSDIAIACKVLRKFGLQLARSHKVGTTAGGADKREWAYTVAATPEWQALERARRRALMAGTDSLTDHPNESVPVTDATSDPGAPPLPDRQFSPPAPPFVQGGGAA